METEYGTRGANEINFLKYYSFTLNLLNDWAVTCKGRVDKTVYCCAVLPGLSTSSLCTVTE